MARPALSIVAGEGMLNPGPSGSGHDDLHQGAWLPHPASNHRPQPNTNAHETASASAQQPRSPGAVKPTRQAHGDKPLTGRPRRKAGFRFGNRPSPAVRWWRGRDLNPRPSGYEPGEAVLTGSRRCRLLPANQQVRMGFRAEEPPTLLVASRHVATNCHANSMPRAAATTPVEEAERRAIAFSLPAIMGPGFPGRTDDPARPRRPRYFATIHLAADFTI